MPHYELSNAINFSKAKYHERLAIILNDPKIAAKTYWSILKTFVNGSKNQTIETVTRLSDIDIDTNTIIKLIRSLNPDKAHGCDGVSTRMLKLYATSISKPRHILFNNSVINECFPNEWKKANIIPVHVKGDKQIIKNSRAVSLLPNCSKIFEKNYLQLFF